MRATSQRGGSSDNNTWLLEGVVVSLLYAVIGSVQHTAPKMQPWNFGPALGNSLRHDTVNKVLLLLLVVVQEVINSKNWTNLQCTGRRGHDLSQL